MNIEPNLPKKLVYIRSISLGDKEYNLEEIQYTFNLYIQENKFLKASNFKIRRSWIGNLEIMLYREETNDEYFKRIKKEKLNTEKRLKKAEFIRLNKEEKLRKKLELEANPEYQLYKELSKKFEVL